jgi:presenilin-like A22 family membrane protease
MIQRIQSLYLLISGLLTISLLLFPPVAAFPCRVSEIGFRLSAFVIAHLAFIAIFLFKKRQKQIRLIYINLIMIAVFYVALFIVFPVSGFQLSAVSPLLSVPFSLLALRAIKKDDELVRSLDRIR